MGRQSQSSSSNVDVVEESRIHGRSSGEWQPLAVIERDGEYRLLFDSKGDEATTDVGKTEMRVRVFGEDEAGNLLQVGVESLSDSVTDSENAFITYLARALDSISDDELRAVQIGTDTGGNVGKIIAEQLDTAVANTDVGQLTYVARALNSSGLDEFVSRVTDSTGTQIDPLNQDALQSVANDELRSRIHDSVGTQIDPLNQDALQSVANDELRARVHDSTGTQIDPLNQDALDSVANDELRSLLLGTDTGGVGQKLIAEQLDTAVANTDVALLTWLSRALNTVGVDELVSRLTDSTGAQINPATNDDQPNFFDEDIVSFDLIGSGDFTVAETNVRGTSNLTFKVNSADSNTFTVTVEWTDGNGNILYTESPTDATSVTDTNVTLETGSDDFQLTITDNSGAAQNNINGTINAH